MKKLTSMLAVAAVLCSMNVAAEICTTSFEWGRFPEECEKELTRVWLVVKEFGSDSAIRAWIMVKDAKEESAQKVTDVAQAGFKARVSEARQEKHAPVRNVGPAK